MWRCVKCQENIEENFDVCWNCGTARDGTEDPDFRKADDVSLAQPSGDSRGDAKRRLGCLTAWLVFMILANSFALVRLPVAITEIEQSNVSFPAWRIWPIFFVAVLNIVFAIALLNWKKWGFFGLVFDSLAALIFNIYIGNPLGVIGVLGIVILFVLLRAGGERNAWSQLE